MSGLVGWWPLHETEGDTAYDLSGNENHGDSVGSFSRGAAGRVGITAYSFDNSGYVEIPDNVPTDGDRSLCYWVKPFNFQRVVGGLDTRSDNTIQIRNQDYGEWDIYVRVYGDGDQEQFSQGHNIEDLVGKWIHLAATFNSDSKIATLYVNGKAVMRELLDVTIGSGEAGFRIGDQYNHEGDDGVNAVYCDARYYNRLLTPAEIQELYRIGTRDMHKKSLSDGTDSGTISRWKLNDGGSDGSTAVDSWGSNDGDIIGDNWAFINDSVRSGDGSLKFVDEDDHVNVGAKLLPVSDNSETFTVSIWIKTEDEKGFNPFFGQYLGSDDERFSLLTNEGIVEYWKGDYGALVESDKTINDGSWYHIVVTKSGSGSQEVTLYINGSISNRGTDEWVFSDVDTRIGHSGEGGSSRYQGQIDDVRVFDRALSSWEVFELYRWGSLGKDLRKELVNKKGGGQ